MMMEGGEWSSFNPVSVNDEADFMAQLFPNCSLDTELESCSLALSSSCYSAMTEGDNASFFSNDVTSPNLYCSSSSAVAYHYHENFCLSDTQQFFAANNTDTCHFPVDLCPSVAKNFGNRFPGSLMERSDSMNLEMSCGGSFEDQPESSDSKYLQLKQESEMSEIEPASEDRSSDESGRKRSRTSEKGKRNVRAKKNLKKVSDDEDNSPDINKQNSSSSSEEESQELGSREIATVNMIGSKTRASRGAATDPQSLYARKRRERINERLRILQNLVPNGTKVDISTMLEEAVQYVKFLQQQIKVKGYDGILYAYISTSEMDHMVIMNVTHQAKFGLVIRNGIPLTLAPTFKGPNPCTQLLSSDDLWMYAPLAYSGMDIGLDSKINALL